VFCTNCGMHNADVAKFCYSCGTALGGSRPVKAVSAPEPKVVPLPSLAKAIGVAFLLLGSATAAMGIVVWFDRVGQGDTSLPAIQNLFTALGGTLVAAYGFLILRRSRLAVGRWWFLAAWPMNLVAPIGLLFLALIVASTLILRTKHWSLYQGATRP
jgi:hypothetical protein